ncbi:hypothetical protein CSB11_00430 [Candidatus Campbellbacteria bacterium]|nr:MAG: hypothetical protein CSB11_00430 [Candidatus Campbellbacteria bacterium]
MDIKSHEGLFHSLKHFLFRFYKNLNRKNQSIFIYNGALEELKRKGSKSGNSFDSVSKIEVFFDKDLKTILSISFFLGDGERKIIWKAEDKMQKFSEIFFNFMYKRYRNKRGH